MKPAPLHSRHQQIHILDHQQHASQNRPKTAFFARDNKKSPAWTTVQQQPREKIRLPRVLGNNGVRKTGDINGNFFCHAKGIKKIEKLSRGTNVQNKDTNESIQLKEYCFLFFFY